MEANFKKKRKQNRKCQGYLVCFVCRIPASLHSGLAPESSHYRLDSRPSTVQSRIHPQWLPWPDSLPWPEAWAYTGFSGSHEPSTSPPWVIKLYLHLDPVAMLLQVSVPGSLPLASPQGTGRRNTEMRWQEVGGHGEKSEPCNQGEKTSTRERLHWQTTTGKGGKGVGIWASFPTWPPFHSINRVWSPLQSSIQVRLGTDQ